jgi:hypothetical protein
MFVNIQQMADDHLIGKHMDIRNNVDCNFASKENSLT